MGNATMARSSLWVFTKLHRVGVSHSLVKYSMTNSAQIV